MMCLKTEVAKSRHFISDLSYFGFSDHEIRLWSMDIKCDLQISQGIMKLSS